MEVYQVQPGAKGPEALCRGERPEPHPGPYEVLIRVRAASLNYRDHMVLTGRYFTPLTRETIPLSDGAGEVVAVGGAVTRFRPGDRVAGAFFQVWFDGPPTRRHPALGVPLDGTLAEYICLHQDGVVAIPPSLSFEQAATLPCAGVTAWNALMVSGKPLNPGETVLCLGTGGVSMLALQIARASGARVIVTSSSDHKLQRACALGASNGINYRQFPEWHKEVERLTDGHGANHIIEIGGAGTLDRSFQAVAFGGKIALIGFLAGAAAETNPVSMMLKSASLQGIGVGSTAMFEALNRAIEINRIQPVVDTVIPFDEAPEAYRRLASGDFVGKLVIAV